jgi:hypothetical protein
MEGLREGREGVGNEGVVVVVLYMEELHRGRDREGEIPRQWSWCYIKGNMG